MEEHEFDALYRESARRLYNFILWTTGNRVACDDILQNVFIKVWRCDRFPFDPGERTALLYTIAHNACIDHFRSVKKFAEYDDAARGAEEASEYEDDGKLAWREAARLPETERSIVYLHLKMGYPYGEIGKLLGMTENNVRVRAFRALRKLRAILIKKGL